MLVWVWVDWRFQTRVEQRAEQSRPPVGRLPTCSREIDLSIGKASFLCVNGIAAPASNHLFFSLGAESGGGKGRRSPLSSRTSQSMPFRMIQLPRGSSMCSSKSRPFKQEYHKHLSVFNDIRTPEIGTDQIMVWCDLIGQHFWTGVIWSDLRRIWWTKTRSTPALVRLPPILA